MKTSDLTADQLRRLTQALRPRLEDLKRLRVRMEEVRFPEHDRFYRDVMLAEILLRDALSEVDSLRSFKGF